MNCSAIVLTLNEERHLDRCLRSLRDVADTLLVVDSHSSDRTVEIARSHGARVLQHAFVNYSRQFNWALDQVDSGTEWVLRIDADELLTAELAAEIRARLPRVEPEVDGIYVPRRMTFQGRLIRHGGVFPVPVLRLFRLGRGRCEDRWMDEHIKVEGRAIEFAGELIDDNLNSLTWWTQKHNHYASREAVDLLNLEYDFGPRDTVARLGGGNATTVKRWLKEVVYARLPGGFRALLYFLYRYVARLGFLDGRAGAAFHVLQGFWYRYLVDAKVAEVKRYMKAQGIGAPAAIERVLGIKV